MISSEGHIQFKKNGRYFVWGEPTKNKHLIIALHGYGQLAEYFIKKFKDIDTSKYVVLCPEAPNRFYNVSTQGRVGASWMTKVDREKDIEDYISFLDTLLESFKSKYDFDGYSLLGFSQGGATASRWLAYGKHKFDRFILWATVFPPDMEPFYFSKFHDSKNYFVFGNRDEYYMMDKVEEHFNTLKKINIPFQMINFEGKHNIHTTTLLNILNE